MKIQYIGIKFKYFSLTCLLILYTVITGSITNIYNDRSPSRIIFVLIASTFTSALPEEMLLRGVLLPRLEKVLKKPINAIIITSIIFNAIHIPILIKTRQGDALFATCHDT